MIFGLKRRNANEDNKFKVSSSYTSEEYGGDMLIMEVVEYDTLVTGGKRRTLNMTIFFMTLVKHACWLRRLRNMLTCLYNTLAIHFNQLMQLNTLFYFHTCLLLVIPRNITLNIPEAFLTLMPTCHVEWLPL
jgi:hypothetical protein